MIKLSGFKPTIISFKSSQMSINDLPNEILYKILNDVSNNNPSKSEQLRERASLSRSSRRLHKFVEPVLYGSLEEINKRSLLLYLRTILEEPQLATNVRQYKGCQQTWTFTTYTVTLFFSWRTVKKTVVHNAIESIVSDKKEARNWLEAIGEGSWDATTALALAQLPRLQHLHLAIIGEHNHYTGCQGAYQGETYHWIKETLMRAAQLQQQGISTPLALEHLTAVTLIPSQEKNRNLSMSQLLPFLKLKSMRKLVARGWDLLRWEVEVDTNFTIVDMELQRFNVAESLVERFFAWFPVLVKLHCEHCYSKAFSQALPVVVGSLSRALIRAGAPLKELSTTEGCASPFD
jgi:hypothetical protein